MSRNGCQIDYIEDHFSEKATKLSAIILNFNLTPILDVKKSKVHSSVENFLTRHRGSYSKKMKIAQTKTERCLKGSKNENV